MHKANFEPGRTAALERPATIDKTTLYKLPWTRENNPNGWIEPTTHCQLKCPFCYRGADREGFVGIHMDLDEVKREVDKLLKIRNVGMITLAGGEPLMYPHLGETIDYIRSFGLDVMILTNGILLDEAMLRDLKQREVMRVVIHIDKHQGREGIRTEEDTLPLRQHFCDLFRKVGGIELGFIQPLGVEDLDDLSVLLPFFKKNVDVIDLVAFNRLQLVDPEGFPEKQLLSAEELFERFRRVYGLEFGAYLGKTQSEGISWLLGFAAFRGEAYLGSMDKEALRFFQEDYHKRKGKWLHSTRNQPRPRSLLFYLPFNRSLRRIFLRFFRAKGGGKLRVQRVLLVNTPEKVAVGEYDQCEGCPDAMLFNGKLVPSCMLEMLKDGSVEVEAG